MFIIGLARSASMGRLHPAQRSGRSAVLLVCGGNMKPGGTPSTSVLNRLGSAGYTAHMPPVEVQRTSGMSGELCDICTKHLAASGKGRSRGQAQGITLPAGPGGCPSRNHISYQCHPLLSVRRLRKSASVNGSDPPSCPFTRLCCSRNSCVIICHHDAGLVG